MREWNGYADTHEQKWGQAPPISWDYFCFKCSIAFERSNPVNPAGESAQQPSFVGEYESGKKEDNSSWAGLKINEDGTCAITHWKNTTIRSHDVDDTDIDTMTGTYEVNGSNLDVHWTIET